MILCTLGPTAQPSADQPPVEISAAPVDTTFVLCPMQIAPTMQALGGSALLPIPGGTGGFASSEALHCVLHAASSFSLASPLPRCNAYHPG